MSKTNMENILIEKEPKKTPKVFFLQLAGKARRFAKSTLFPSHVTQLLSKRKGECNRCGACCKLAFTCPFYSEKEGKGTCSIYGKHFAQCNFFPIEPKDLVGLENVCDYTFEGYPKS